MSASQQALLDPAHTSVIVDAVRTPIGRFRGALKDVRADDLAAVAIKALVERTGLATDLVHLIDDVYLGCANQAGEDNRNVARMALLLAGLPQAVPGATVNRLCGSGLLQLDLCPPSPAEPTTKPGSSTPFAPRSAVMEARWPPSGPTTSPRS